MIEHNIPQTSNPREIAYFALLASIRNTAFVSDILDAWRNLARPSLQDMNLAQELAYGSARMAATLDYLAQELTDQKKLSLKPKEKALLRIAIYQFQFMDRIPPYAVVDESVKIAKKYCHPTFVNFLNAILRKAAVRLPNIPNGISLVDLSIRYSYPLFYIEELMKEFDVNQVKEILELGNIPSKPMVRLRSNQQVGHVIVEKPFPVAVINDPSMITKIANSKDFYIQNVTPSVLMGALKAEEANPEKILDLCAAPGGKTLLIHDIYPKAKLFANDISEEKTTLLKENFRKYKLDVNLSFGLGQNYNSEQAFDLIILDVPCSNTGVLNKRAEARWRLSNETLIHLEETQWALIEKAVSMLHPNGEIWYMTCSILERENNGMMRKVCHKMGLEIVKSILILPNHDGWDGGYACSLRLAR